MIKNIVYLILFIVPLIYILIKDRELFQLKLIASIPILIIILYFSRTMLFLPVYIFSLITATYLYTIFFYVPFFIDLGFILYSLLLHALPLKYLLFSISIAVLLSMFLDKNMESYARTNNDKKGKNIKKEFYRDYFQIGTGVITILVFIYFGTNGKVIILFTILLIYLFGNILYLHRDNKITYLVYKMERDETKLGLGSMYLASGFMLVLALINSLSLILLSAFILMIGDSLATIFGMKIRSKKLFYNKKKSMAGFAFMLIPSAIFGVFFLVYYYSIIYSLIGTVSESLSNKIADDNIAIPVSIVLIHFIITTL